MNRNNDFIPVVIKTSLDLPPLWGRLVRLSPDDADLQSQFELAAGRVLALSFELGDKSFEDIRARISRALRDGTGYFNYSLALLDPAQSAALRSALLKAAAPDPRAEQATK